MKKYVVIFSILIFSLYGSIVVFAAGTAGYQPLTPIPGITSDIPTTSTGGTSGTGFASYLRALYVWGVAAASGLAVVMIMWGGVEYMTSAGGHGVEEAKKRISSAIAGLLLALGSYIILYTVNRDLLNLNFAIGTQTVDVNGNAAAKVVPQTGPNPLGTPVDPTKQNQKPNQASQSSSSNNNSKTRFPGDIPPEELEPVKANDPSNGGGGATGETIEGSSRNRTQANNTPPRVNINNNTPAATPEPAPTPTPAPAPAPAAPTTGNASGGQPFL